MQLYAVNVYWGWVCTVVWELLNHSLNLWLITWGKHWVSPGSTGEGNSAVWPEGVEPGCTSPRPHLRADYHWERIFFLEISPLWSFSCKPRSLDTGKHSFSVFFSHFHHDNLSSCSSNCVTQHYEMCDETGSHLVNTTASMCHLLFGIPDKEQVTTPKAKACLHPALAGPVL